MRALLREYVPPGKDVFGARFIFPRAVDGQSFVTSGNGTLRFHADYNPKMIETSTGGQGSSRSRSDIPYKLRLDVKFKLADMAQDGELEY